MTQEQTINYVVLFIVCGLVAIGLLSMLIGRLVEVWDSFSRWWGYGVHKAIHTRPRNMSSNNHVPAFLKSNREQRTYAVEHSLEHSGTGNGNTVPDLVEQLGTLSDDELLDILARIKDANGDLKYADSRIAKFIGGRVEDRVAQVRDVRGKEPPSPSEDRVLRVRDNGVERLILR